MTGLGAIAINLWPSFVEKVEDVVRAGLESLAAEAEDGGLVNSCEDDLNRDLFFRMHRIAAERQKALFNILPRPMLSREHTWSLAPMAEANNQPSPDDPERTPRENKRPDFQWSFQDDQVEDLARATRAYVVECKRLGQAIGSWVLNTNYVAHDRARPVACSRSAHPLLGHVQIGT